MGLMGTLSIWVVNAQEVNKDIILEATATESGQTLKINKYFKNAYTVDWGDGTTWNLTADTRHTYGMASGYTITLSLSWANKWTFQNVTKPLVPKDGTTVTWVKIIYMPSLADGFGNSATNPWDYFFSYFNKDWALTSLPDNSFDTSNITTAGYNFFSHFNQTEWKLTSLPTWSFNISNITSVQNYFFNSFNSNWKLTNLPIWSFRFSSWLTIAKDEFFAYFNNKWALTSLPTWSFNTSYIAVAQSDFFYSFNYNGALISLPNNSFDISNITKTRSMFFSRFNAWWQLTSLPAWSFKFSSWLGNVWAYFFEEFNSNWKLTSLPTWSFNTSNITGIQQYFFARFNAGWQLTSLPTWSFNTSNIINVKNWWWSFDDFNCWWQIRTLPDSFTLNSILVVSGWYSHSFDSSSYTLNKRVSDLVSGITAPSTDKNTFSDNQPWRCGVHPNWLVNPTNACNVKYDANWWTWTTTWWYNSDTTGVVPWLNITSPTREWYTLSGWNDASWNKIDEILFPTMDGQTLYANWMPIEYEINYELNDWVLSWNNATWYTIESETITLINPTKTWYTFTWRSGTNLDSLTTSVTIPTWSTWDREYEANWQINQYTITFKDWDNEITSITADYWTWITLPPNPTKNGYTFKWRDKPVPSTMPAEHMTISAKWERNWSSGWWGWGGGWGGSSKTDTGSASSQTWSQIDSNTGSTTSWTNEKGPETTTGNKAEIETWSQQPLSPTDSSPDREQTVTPLIGGDGEARGGWTQTYTQEFQEAYEFARWNWITTMPTIQKANMEWKLTRIAMAKMLSQYAINVLWKTPDATLNNKFNDVTDKLDLDYDDWVTLAYQLWIMWQNMPWNNFRPDDEVTRAEFATALSRMLYNTWDWQYKSTDKYYTNHMSKLVKEWIITKDDPKMKELRWYVMIMLMRSAK